MVRVTTLYMAMRVIIFSKVGKVMMSYMVEVVVIHLSCSRMLGMIRFIISRWMMISLS